MTLLPTPEASSVSSQSDKTLPLLPDGCNLVFALVAALFSLWGIPNNLNDILIRQL
jgi:FHS family L-fucose permease-like MFS transporter